MADIKLNIYKGKYTDVEKELAGYKQQEKEYRKGLGAYPVYL